MEKLTVVSFMLKYLLKQRQMLYSLFTADSGNTPRQYPFKLVGASTKAH